MANKKKSEADYSLDIQNEVDHSDKNDITKTKLCNIANISNGKLHFYFDGCGIQLDIPKDKHFSIGDAVNIGYSGTMGTADFRKWIIQ